VTRIRAVIEMSRPTMRKFFKPQAQKVGAISCGARGFIAGTLIALLSLLVQIQAPASGVANPRSERQTNPPTLRHPLFVRDTASRIEIQASVSSARAFPCDRAHRGICPPSLQTHPKSCPPVQIVRTILAKTQTKSWTAFEVSVRVRAHTPLGEVRGQEAFTRHSLAWFVVVSTGPRVHLVTASFEADGKVIGGDGMQPVGGIAVMAFVAPRPKWFTTNSVKSLDALIRAYSSASRIVARFPFDSAAGRYGVASWPLGCIVEAAP